MNPPKKKGATASSPKSLKFIGDQLNSASKDAEIASLKERLLVAEKTNNSLALAMERARKAPPARVLRPSVSKKTVGDIIRVIIPDTHGSKVDKLALEACLGDVKSLDCSDIILLGDHVDCGGFLAQHHTMGYVSESAYTYEHDIAETNAFLNTLQSVAPKATIDYLEGNHERRIEQWAVTQTLRNQSDAEFLRRAFSPEYLLQLSKRGISYYRQGVYYDDLPLPGTIRRGKCYFFHGSSTSKQATTVTLNSFAGNVVFGHTHREQSSSARPVHAGQIKAFNPGCLCELQPLWQHTNPTSWTHGYAVQIVARSGNFLHLNIPIVDGKSLLGSLASKF
jgi:predicted phosphodiesterase